MLQISPLTGVNMFLRCFKAGFKIIFKIQFLGKKNFSILSGYIIFFYLFILQ